MSAPNVASRNTDQQIRINARLFDVTHEVIKRVNNVISKVNAIDSDLHATTTLLHKAIILANQVAEITPACQLDKSGVINTNLLDHGDRVDIKRNGWPPIPKCNRNSGILSPLYSHQWHGIWPCLK